MNHETMETAISYSGKVMYTGAGSAVFFGMSLNEIGVIFGMALGLAGFFVNVTFKWLEHRRLKVEHERRMEKMITKPGELHEL
jgi:hypothetical protein